MKFLRRNDKDILGVNQLKELFPTWQADECWLFVGPHDDDIVLGAGLMMRAAIEAGVDVHALVATDGEMGYCYKEQEGKIGKIREEETKESFRIIGLPDDRFYFAGIPDCDTTSFVGRRKAKAGEPAIEGYTGLQNAFTYYIRKVKPSRIFVATHTDYHPDHKIVNQEILISNFHAGGNIWPELGGPVPSAEVYEYGVYCDFPEAPNLKVEGDEKNFKKKIDAIMAYKSQEQIAAIVDSVKDGGAIEYYREVEFKLYSVNNYKDLF